MLEELMKNFPVILNVLMGLGSLLVFAQAVVLATPSKKDNKRLEDFRNKPLIKKVWSFLVSFAPIKKKNGKALPSHEDK